jgi:phospholipid transport system substrate-binding protein
MKTSRMLMAAAIAVGTGMAVLISPAPATAAGTATVQAFYDTLLNTMRNGQRLGMQGRSMQIGQAIRQHFDIPYMTRLAVGPSWNQISDAQRAQVSQAFEHYIAAVYAERFDNYSGEQFRVIGEQASPGGGTLITSQIIKSDGEPVHISYLMHQGQIADVYLNGSISEVATRRSEFSSILRTQGVDGLISALNAKTAALGGARAS